jgi:hypothetical protein
MRYSEIVASDVVLSEASEQQEGFEMMARSIITALSNKTFQHFLKMLTGYPSMHLEIYDCAGVSIDEVYPNRKGVSKLPDSLKAFYKANRNLVVTVDEARGNVKGQYQPKRYEGGQPVITLFYDPEDFAKAIEKNTTSYPVNPWELGKFFNTRFDTLVHELTHAYDAWASSGKYIGHPRTAEFYKDTKNYDKYLNQPLEINARFYQVVSQMYHERRKTWKEYLNYFRWNFPGWKLLPDDEKRRLIQRLAVEYGKHNTPKPMDISGQVKRLEAKLEQRYGTQINLYFNDHVDSIVVNHIETKDKQQRAEILWAVTRLADVYRKTVTTSEPFQAQTLKDLGFVANRGRNKDYRTRDAFYRRSKRADVTSPGGLMKAA